MSLSSWNSGVSIMQCRCTATTPDFYDLGQASACQTVVSLLAMDDPGPVLSQDDDGDDAGVEMAANDEARHCSHVSHLRSVTHLVSESQR